MRIKLVSTVLALGLSGLAAADEGMWQPHQLPEIESILKQKGLEIDPKSISKLTEFPMNAVISLGGCTASFVSPKGLVVTNHHCAYGSIQYNSTPEKNILADGFLAKNHQQELPAAPGSRVYVTKTVENVTKQVSSQLTDAMTGTERYKAIDSQRKALVAECEKDAGYRCNVYTFHGGLEYYLIKQLEIKDVRLVYNPAASIGKYGGDIDNWMWPRHTGDYSFYRAYVGKDGKPAEFAKDNVPYQSDSFLKVNAKGVEAGDFVMVTGYPGRTNRYRTAGEVKHQFTFAYPTAKTYREKTIEIIKQTAPEGSKARIAYESTLAGLANYAKNYGGMITSYQAGDMQSRKDTLASDLNTWINSDKQLKNQYGSVLNELDQLIIEQQATAELDLALNYLGRSSMLSTAYRLVRLAHEKQKPDMERDSGYQDRDMTRFEASMKRISRRFDSEVDKAVLLYFIEQYAALPKTQRLVALDNFFGIKKGFNKKKVTRLVNKMYKKTKLDEEKTRLNLMSASVKELERSNDPFIQYAVAMFDTFKQRENDAKELSGKLNKVRPEYMAAIIAYNKAKGLPVYADANSTLRVTYGTVKGYSPKDALVYTPFTRLEGIAQKDTGVAPFDSPKAQLELIKAKTYGKYEMKSLNSVPVNFLSTVDTTGGNSGSPTLNGKAELVGLLFDGVIESIVGDWDYDPSLNRSIHVDSRYMLWVMEHIDNADNLIAEMDIVR